MSAIVNKTELEALLTESFKDTMNITNYNRDSTTVKFLPPTIATKLPFVIENSSEEEHLNEERTSEQNSDVSEDATMYTTQEIQDDAAAMNIEIDSPMFLKLRGLLKFNHVYPITATGFR